MGLFDGYLICTDCDGTLTSEEKQISDKNIEAINYFQKEGGLFTLATGRFPSHMKNFQDRLKVNAPFVSMNGAVLFDTDNNDVIAEWPMKTQDVRELFYYIYDNYNEVWEYWFNIDYESSINFKPMESSREDLEKFFDDRDEKIYKIVIIQKEDLSKEIQKDIKEKFSDKFRFDLSWPNGLEIQSVDSSKGKAVRYMKNHLDKDIKITIGVGDYENDISLIEDADLGYAVDNAIDSVKKAADRITVSNKEDAIANIIYEIEKEIRDGK